MDAHDFSACRFLILRLPWKRLVSELIDHVLRNNLWCACLVPNRINVDRQHWRQYWRVLLLDHDISGGIGLVILLWSRGLSSNYQSHIMIWHLLVLEGASRDLLVIYLWILLRVRWHVNVHPAHGRCKIILVVYIAARWGHLDLLDCIDLFVMHLIRLILRSSGAELTFYDRDRRLDLALHLHWFHVVQTANRRWIVVCDLSTVRKYTCIEPWSFLIPVDHVYILQAVVLVDTFSSCIDR